MDMNYSNYRGDAPCLLEIDFDALINESVVSANFQSRIGNANIEVYSDEGDYLAHFHIVSKDHNFDCCIRINAPEYFPYGKHRSKFYNLKQKKILNEKLSEMRKESGKTYWQEIRDLYYAANMSCKEPKANNQPDYTLLN